MDINQKDTNDNNRQWFSSACSSGDDTTTEHHLPRVGEEYQAKVPELMTIHDYLCFNQHSGILLNEPLYCEFSQPVADCARIDDNSVLSHKATDLDQMNNSCCSACSLSANRWKDIERKSFLLSLYTFGKNFHLAKKFMETKKMSDVLTFYYGKFYESTEYKKWSNTRKMKGKRSMQKDQIYKGWRQRELLSRMFPHLSYDCQISLNKVADRFKEGTLSLEDYVFTLKDMVGITLLVGAVAIGKEKEDLTGTTFRHGIIRQSKNKPDITICKAWCSLNEDEIIEHLHGKRLGKAQSSDFFWGAVWPRLLERGWHSEQRSDRYRASSINSFVFFVPGVQNLSSKKLVKGNHYFDSVIEVLNKVAAEPEHLKLGSEEVEVGADKENCISDPQVSLNQKHHCDLQLQNSNFSQEKFPIVDTRFVHGEKLVKTGDVNSLPVNTMSLSTLSALSSGTEQRTIYKSKYESEVRNAFNINMENGPCADKTDVVLNNALYHKPGDPDTKIAAVENHMDRKYILLNDGPLIKPKFQFRSHHTSNLEPVTDLGEFSAYSRRVEIIQLDEEEANFVSSPPDRLEVQALRSEAGQSLTTSTLKTEESTEKAMLSISTEKPKFHTTIDLNYPYISPESGTNEPVTVELSKSSNIVTVEEQPVDKGRSQSSRNREMTKRALEAISMDFLGPKQKRKGANSLSRSSSSRKVRGKTGSAAGEDGTAYQEGPTEGDTGGG